MNGENKPSQMLNVSVRGWVTLIAITSVCIITALGREVTEPLYSVSIAIVAFYFGQNNKQTQTPLA